MEGVADFGTGDGRPNRTMGLNRTKWALRRGRLSSREARVASCSRATEGDTELLIQ